MTNKDYESILKRVATKTGHGSVESLWHYIDLAWKEINIWGGVDNAIARLHAADRLFEELLALKREMEVLKTPSAKDLLPTIIARLDEIIKSNKFDLYV